MFKKCIFGGSFDITTKSHMEIILELSKHFDQVIVVPNLCTYYRKKPFMFSFEYRCDFLLELISKYPHLKDKVIVDTIEETLTKEHTFIDTLIAIQEAYQHKVFVEDGIMCTQFDNRVYNTEYYVAIGADSYNNFTTWHSWEKILDRAKLVVFKRDGYNIIKNEKVPYESLIDLKESDSYIDDGCGTDYRYVINKINLSKATGQFDEETLNILKKMIS